jgi:uncharacterized protein YneF (UPF0154 family)
MDTMIIFLAMVGSFASGVAIGVWVAMANGNKTLKIMYAAYNDELRARCARERSNKAFRQTSIRSIRKIED